MKIFPSCMLSPYGLPDILCDQVDLAADSLYNDGTNHIRIVFIRNCHKGDLNSDAAACDAAQMIALQGTYILRSLSNDTVLLDLMPLHLDFMRKTKDQEPVEPRMNCRIEPVYGGVPKDPKWRPITQTKWREKWLE